MAPPGGGAGGTLTPTLGRDIDPNLRWSQAAKLFCGWMRNERFVGRGANVGELVRAGQVRVRLHPEGGGRRAGVQGGRRGVTGGGGGRIDPPAAACTSRLMHGCAIPSLHAPFLLHPSFFSLHPLPSFITSSSSLFPRLSLHHLPRHSRLPLLHRRLRCGTGALGRSSRPQRQTGGCRRLRRQRRALIRGPRTRSSRRGASGRRSTSRGTTRGESDTRASNARPRRRDIPPYP